MWYNVTYILLINFRSCEVWQWVRTALFKVLTSGKFHILSGYICILKICLFEPVKICWQPVSCFHDTKWGFRTPSNSYVDFAFLWHLSSRYIENMLRVKWKHDMRLIFRPPSKSYVDFATLGTALVNPKPRPYMVRN